jgi:hypothetical protein
MYIQKSTIINYYIILYHFQRVAATGIIAVVARREGDEHTQNQRLDGSIG